VSSRVGDDDVDSGDVGVNGKRGVWYVIAVPYLSVCDGPSSRWTWWTLALATAAASVLGRGVVEMEQEVGFKSMDGVGGQIALNY